MWSLKLNLAFDADWSICPIFFAASSKITKVCKIKEKNNPPIEMVKELLNENLKGPYNSVE